MTASRSPARRRTTRPGGARRASGKRTAKKPAARRKPLTKAQRQARRREWRVRWIVFGAFASVVVLTAGTIALLPKAPVLPDIATVAVNPSAVPPMSVAGYDQEQITNAAVIVDVGAQLGLSTRDQVIAVMTAMGESSLRNIDYGDWETSGERNPDGSRTSSVGLFQQQDWWGSREARLDPATTAGLFYAALARKVPDRDALEPTVVAHRVQVNDDPEHYAEYWEPAVAVVAALAASSAAR